MSDASPDPEPVELSIVWVGVEELPALWANQAVIQHSAEDEFVLTFGQLALPLLAGTPEQQRKQAEDLGYLEIKPVARLTFNRQRLHEFITVMQENLKTHDKRFSAGGSDG